MNNSNIIIKNLSEYLHNYPHNYCNDKIIIFLPNNKTLLLITLYFANKDKDINSNYAFEQIKPTFDNFDHVYFLKIHKDIPLSQEECFTYFIKKILKSII